MSTENQIRTAIKTQLKSLNHNRLEIDDDTIVGDVFAKPTSISKNNASMFEHFIIWALNFNGHKPSKGGKNKFPPNWKVYSVSELAKSLFMLIFILIGFISQAQLQVSVGAVRTDLKQSALNFAFRYIQSADSMWGGNEFMISGKHSYFIVTPDIEFKTGTSDAFSSIVGKATAMFVSFKTKTVDDFIQPDADKLVHLYPLSLGVETNKQFQFINGLLEAGYEPYYQSPLAKIPEWLKYTKIGAYFQAGHKFKLSDSVLNIGGSADQSQELAGNSILRLKANACIDTKALINISQLRIGVSANGTVWFDLLNKATYYKAEGNIRFYLTDDAFFDLQYMKGSGAPNFNTGDQFGLALTVNL